MVVKTLSKNNIPIRLTDERWSHITEEHYELAGMRLELPDVIANPSRVLAGNACELLAVREISEGRHLVVVYREIKDTNDGCIITAFLTSKSKSLDRRKQIWPG
jgi:hypothetical protein